MMETIHGVRTACGKKQERATSPGKRGDNERGIALIMALVMLVLLGILGAFALSTSSTELFITGNYRNAQTAFYRADGAAEFAQLSGTIYTAIARDIGAPTHIWPPVGTGDYAGDPDFNVLNALDDAFTGDTARAKVQYIICGNLPAGSGTMVTGSLTGGGGTLSKADYFAVTVVGMGPNNSEITIESQVARVAAECP